MPAGVEGPSHLPVTGNRGRLLPACLLWLLLCWLGVPLAATASPALQPYQAVSAVSVLADGGQYAIRSTTALALDRRERLWVGGFRHLLRVDGVQVHSFRPGQNPLLPEGHIRALLALDNGDMLIGGNREGVLLWELDSGRLVPLEVTDGPALTRINDLTAARDGGVWVSAEQGLFHWAGGHARTLQAVPALQQLPTLSARVMSALQADDGSLWVAAHNGLYRRAADAQAFVPVRSGQAALDRRLAGETVWTLRQDGRGRVWAGLVRSGVVVFDAGRAFAPAGLDGINGLHQGRTIRSLLWADGQMWLGTDGSGLLACRGSCQQARTVPVSLSAFEGQRNFHVRGLAQAADGRIWAASDRGIFHFDPDPQGIHALDVTPPGMDPHQRLNATRALWRDRARQQLWLGREAGELLRWNLASGKRDLLYLPAPHSASAVNALGTDAQGKLWVAGSGVVWVDPQSLKVRPAGQIGGQARSQVNHMVVGPQRVWLGYHDGLVEVDLDGRIRRQMLSTSGTGLGTTHIVALALQGGWLWAGTPQGLYRIDLARWQAEPVTLLPSADPAQAERTGLINALAADGPALWVATAGGVFRVDGDSLQVRAVEPTLGLEVMALQLAADGRPWFSARPTTIGTVGSDGRVRLYGAHDGVHDNRGFHRGVAMGLEDGSVLFGTGTGVLAVDPARLPPRPAAIPALQPVITGLQIDGQRWAEGALPAPGQALQLKPEQQRLMIEFSALQMLSMERRRYAFMLEGQDPDWVELEPGAAPMALYGKLPPGDYRLALRVESDEQPGLQWISHYPLQVLPQWYQRGWVWALALAGTVLLLSLLVWLRDRIVRRRQRQLEQLVYLRTCELQQANRQLSALAGEDALTGLYNRRRLLQRMNELISQAQRQPHPASLVLLDLDHFKHINDSHGHLAGDAVLRQVAGLLQASLRAHDMAARYGGEELLVLLPDTDQDTAQEVAERLRLAIAGMTVVSESVQLSVTASFGVAQLQAQHSAEQWIERADMALYRAKREGRNRVCVERLPD